MSDSIPTEVSLHIRGANAGAVMEQVKALAGSSTSAEPIGPQTGGPGFTKILPEKGQSAQQTAEKVTTDKPVGRAARSKPAETAKDKPAETKPDPAPEKAAAPEEKAAPEKTDKKGPTIEDVKAKVRKFLGTFENNAEGQGAAKKILAENYGVDKVADLDEEQYPDAILVFCNAIEEREDSGVAD